MLRNGRLRASTNYPSNFNNNPTSASRRRWIRFQARCSRPLDQSYAVLGLTPLASKSDVKQAYRRLALKYHPDVHKGEGKTFKEIKSAYESLMQKLDEDEFTNEADGFDEYDEWDEWMGFEGGIPVIYNPF